MKNEKGYVIRTVKDKITGEKVKKIYIQNKDIVDIDKLKATFEYEIVFNIKSEQDKIKNFNKEESLQRLKETGRYDFKEGTLELDVKNPFKIPYEHATREQMETYLNEYCSKEDYKNFVLYSHAKKEKGVNINSITVSSKDDIARSKNGKAIYKHIQAKDYFYYHYFKEDYDRIMKERQKTKSKAANPEMKRKEQEIEDIINDLLK